MKSRWLSACWFGLFLALALTQYAAAQATISYALLNGTVTDEAGRTVAQAKITVRSLDTNQTFTAASNDTGFYALPSLPPGPYELSVSYAGFGQYTRTGVVLTVGQTATMNVTLKVAAVKEEVVVSTEAPVVETTRTEISQVIDTNQIMSLPVSGRLFTDFALLAPGVATGRTSLGTTFTEFEITQISFGGMRSFSNEITVDGADFINSNTGVQRATPPQEAVQEFRVVNNSFGSEYGRALGGIVNVATRSGTNNLHGSVYDYLQNSALDSRSLLQPRPAPFALRQNQFGGTLGGPIVKDKTFFFLNYEGKRRAEFPPLPTDFRANITEINLAKSYLGLPLEPTDVLKTTNNDYGFARLDHQFSANNRLALRYNVEDARDLNELVGNTEDGGGLAVPSGGRNLFIRDQSVVGTFNSVIKPNLVNTVLGQYARRHYNFPGATGQPNLDIPNDLEMGHNFGTLDGIYESRTQFSDSLSWLKGNHVAKFGFDSNYIWDATWYPGFAPARIILPDLNCLADFANFVDKLGLAAENPVAFGGSPCPLPAPLFHGVGATFYGLALARTNYQDGLPPLNNAFPLDTTNWANAFAPQLYSSYNYNLNHGYYGFFAQDQWRITPKFTLNYGVRYDLETGLGKQINPYHGGVQPRVGIAYAPDDKTVIRAGFGLFDDRTNMTFFFIDGNDKTIANFLPGIKLPMVRQGADTAGWVLNLVNAAGVSPPPVACSSGIVIAPWGICLGAAADAAKSILTTGLYPNETISGACDPLGAFTGTPQFNCTAGSGGMDLKKSKIPYAEQASLEIDRTLGKGLTIDVGYLMVQAHRLVLGNGLNVSCPVGTSKPNNPAGPGIPAPFPNTSLAGPGGTAQGWLNPDGTTSPCQGNPILLAGKPFFTGVDTTTGQGYGGLEFSNGGFLDYNVSLVNAIYHGLTFQAMERLGKYFNLNASYTYSHIIDNGNFTTFINLPQNQFDNKSERASSNQDVRHRFVANFTANTPNRGVAKNFTFSSIVTIQSGRPFTMFTGGDSNGDTNPVTDRVGLSGRNSYIGQPLRTWDFRVSRFFQLSERVKVDFIFDAFNLLNRQNVDEVATVYGSPVFCGAVPRHFGDAASLAVQQSAPSTLCPSLNQLTAAGQIPPGPLPAQFPTGVIPGDLTSPITTVNPTFGTPRAVLNPRQLQFALKFSF